MTVLDKEGLAIKDETVTLYDFCPLTGEFMGAFEWKLQQGTGLPAHSTLIVPPPVGQAQQAIFKDNRWELVADYRNCRMFSITTGAMMDVPGLGEIPDGFTLAAPTSLFDEYINGKWVKNIERERRHIVQENQEHRKELLLDANLVINGTQDFIDSGVAPAAIVAMHKAWRNYRARLFLVSLPNPEWPDVPSEDIEDYHEALEAESKAEVVQKTESVNQEVVQNDDSVNQNAVDDGQAVQQDS